MHRINFLAKILYWFPESNPPDKCHWAISSLVNQHKGLLNRRYNDGFLEVRPANFSRTPTTPLPEKEIK